MSSSEALSKPPGPEGVRLSERLDREGGTMKYALGWACYHIYMSRKTWPRWAEDLLLPWAGYYAF